jgi:LacI family transcriptional regulator
VEGRDDNERTRVLAADLLSRQPDLVGLYSVGAGNRGIAAALEASGRAPDIVWIAHELTVHTRALLLRGVIDAIINQDPGHEARSAARVSARPLSGRSRHARPGADQHRHLPARQSPLDDRFASSAHVE